MIYVLSGNAKAFAVIGVTYPAGSTCTCSDGTKTLNLKNTSGQGFFLIPYAATWTVACTDGTNTKSLSVEVVSEGQSESVTLSYQLVLFDGSNGGDNNELTGGWTKVGADTFTVSNDKIYYENEESGDSAVTVVRYARTNSAIDLTDYSRLTIKFTDYSCETYHTSLSFGVMNTTSNFAATKGFGVGEYSLDISSITGAHYIGFRNSIQVYGTLRDSFTATYIALE